MREYLTILDRFADHTGLLHQIVWEQFSSSIRLLLHNQYVFQPFWDDQSGKILEDDCKKAFERSKASANRALGRMDTIRVVAEIFDRLYTLRNQINHGGSTWNSRVNRGQMKDGANILGHLVPTVIHLMMENHNQLWGDAHYPVVDVD